MDLRKLSSWFSCFGLSFEVIYQLISKFSSSLEVSTTIAFVILASNYNKKTHYKNNLLNKNLVSNVKNKKNQCF